MLDWLLSKIGLMIFIAVLVAVVFSFSAFQLNFLDRGKEVQAANTISKIIDSVCENCSINYQLPEEYTIEVSQRNLTVNTVLRNFLSNATPGSIKSKNVRIYKEDGIVHVKAI